jgi:hypothetical protein
MPYKYMASLIVAFTAATSFITMTALPFGLGKFTLLLALLKASLVALWLWAAWRVKDRREKAFIAKQTYGNLWTGPINEGALCIPLKDFEVIKYHLDADEKVKRVFRRHKFTLWKATLWANVCFWSLIAFLLMLSKMPSLEFHPSDWHIWLHPKIHGEEFTILKETVPVSDLSFSFVWWWFPLLIATFAFYESIKHWQIRKWSIRIITTKNIYLFREQPTYIPWIPPKFGVIPVHQVVGMRADVGSFGGMVGWSDIALQVRADEHDDEPEPVVIDYVAEGNEVIGDLRQVLPIFESRLQPAQPVVVEPAEGANHEVVDAERDTEQSEPQSSAQDRLF